MMRHILPTLAALAVCAFPLAAQAASDESSGSMGMERMQNWAADHEAFLDAKLAGLKAGLKLTSDQDKLWPPFETAVRDAAKLHMEQMKSMMERMQKMHEMMQSMKKSEDMKEAPAPGPAVSPIDRLEAMGQRMSERGAAITKSRRRRQAPVREPRRFPEKTVRPARPSEMFMMGHGHRGMGMMRGWDDGRRMMGQGDMGMMGQEVATEWSRWEMGLTKKRTIRTRNNTPQVPRLQSVVAG